MICRQASCIRGLVMNPIDQRFKSNYSKKLGVYSYKVKKTNFKLYRNPHMVPLKLREQLYKVLS